MMKKIPYILVFIAILSMVFSPLFIKVKPVCSSQYGDCPFELTEKFKLLNNKSLFYVKRQTGAILKDNYLVSAFSSQYKIPNLLMVNIIIKKPTFAITDDLKNKFALIDANGLVLSFTDKTNLPLIIKSFGDIKTGQYISADDLFALKLIGGVYQMYQIESGTIVNDSLIVDMPGQIRVIFPLRGRDTDVLLGALRLIYSKLTSENSGKYSQIDMRYKNPVLR